MKVKIEKYRLVIENKNYKENDLPQYLDDIVLEDFLDYYYNNYSFELTNTINDMKLYSLNVIRQKEIIEKKTTGEFRFFNRYVVKDDTSDFMIRKIMMNYGKYGEKTDIVDDSYETKYTKEKNQAALEKQHMMMYTLDNSSAIIFFEFVYGAISKSRIKTHMNKIFTIWKKEHYESEDYKKRKLHNYKIEIYDILSDDFIAAIRSLDKISLIQSDVTIDSFPKKDNDVIYAREKLKNKCVTLSFKPEKEKFFTKDETVKYFEQSQTGDKIKRILIKGVSDNSSITIDSNKLKSRELLHINEDSNGKVNTEDLFDKLKEFAEKHFETAPKNIFDFEADEPEE